MAELDAALALLRDHDRPDLANHGPMAAEALDALGYGSLAPHWALDYRTREGLAELPHDEPLRDGELAAARGDPGRRAAFTSRMDRELAEERWQDVLRRWLPRLAPGASADAAHCLIRTAHAARGLGRKQTPERRHELAEALGYWASHYEELPGAPGRGTPGLASRALAAVPCVPLGEQVYQGLITDRLRALPELAGFGDAVSALAPDSDLEAFASDLARTSAHLYVANAPRARAIDFIHALDGVYAVRELVPFLGTDDARDLAFHGWQVVAGLHATAGHALPPAELEAPSAAELPALVDRAVRVGGAHAIKFAQACVAEHALDPDPVYRAALADMVERMETLKEKLGLVL